MSFVDFFRKKWKHSDPEVRAEAVRDLDVEAELAEVLQSDSDARVRRIALKKVVDPEVLSQVAESDTDDALRRAAAEKATAIFVARAVSDGDEQQSHAALRRIAQGKAIAEVAKNAAIEAVRHAALTRLTDDKSLSDVARNAKDAALRRSAVERIQEPTVLRDLAIGETAKEVGLAAVARLDDVNLLDTVARRARNKQVATVARERLPQTAARAERGVRAPEEVSPEARRRARQAQLIREIEHAIGLADLAEAERSIAALGFAWKELGQNVDGDEHQKKMEKVLERFAIRKRTLEEAHRAHVHAHPEAVAHKPVEEDRAVVEAREALCVRVEGLDGEGLREAVEQARTAWQELPRLIGPRGKELEIRFRKAVDAGLRRVELSLSKARLHEKLEALVLEAEGLTGTIKEVEPQLRALRRRMTDLEAAGFDEALRSRFRRIEERIEADKAELVQRRATEDSEALARLEELVTRLEGLVESTDRKKLESELKVAHSAFESARVRGPAVQAVRARYAAARDKAAAQAQDLRDAENWKRWANVPQLERLCEQMESIARALAFEQAPAARAAAGAAAIEALTAESATAETPASPVEAAAEAPASDTATSHAAAAAAESAPIDSPGAEPAVEGHAPAAAAEPAEVAPPVGAPAIFGKGGKVDLKKATAFMRVLQAEWKTVGPAPKERSEQLWQRFKISGDEVYHRTHTGFEKLGESRGDNLKAKEQLCAQVEALIAPFAGSAPGAGAEGDGSASDNERAALWRETAEKIKALQEEWKKVGPVAKDQADVVWKRFRAACDQFFGQRKEVAGKASGERADNVKKLEELCQRVETLAEAPDFKQAATEIKAAQAEWRSVGPVPRGESDKLWKRFRAACDRFFNRRTTQFAEQDGERTGNLEKKQKLCERAEALVEKAREGNREAAMKEAKQLQAEWKKAGPVPREHGDAIWRRFRAACDKVFEPEEVEAAPVAPPSPQDDPRNWPKFENKLPLAGVLAQLAGATAAEPSSEAPPEAPAEKPAPVADP